MKLEDWQMREALGKRDYPAAIAVLQGHFGLNLQVDSIAIQPPDTWGVEWGVELIIGYEQKICYAWFQSDSFWMVRGPIEREAKDPVTAYIWEVV
jgi:hypothetical protein